MRPTYNLFLAMAERSPTFINGAAQLGFTPAQAVAQIFDRFSGFQAQAARDAFLSTFAQTCDMHIASEAHFDKASDDLAARPVSEVARMYGPSIGVDRIKQLHEVASNAGLQQAISERMRDTDHRTEQHQPPPLPKHAHARMQGEDARDLRSAVHAAVAGTRDGSPPLQVANADNASLRDTLRAAFDGHAALDAEADPLADDGLRSMSDAV